MTVSIMAGNDETFEFWILHRNARQISSTTESISELFRCRVQKRTKKASGAQWKR